MTFDTFLGIFGSATGVLGVYLAYHFYRKSIRTKVLAIAYTDPLPLMVAFADIEVSYEGVIMSAFSRFYILFWNQGTSPIEASDFLEPITIGCSVPILNLKLQDKDPAAAVHLDEATGKLSIDLLRPGEAVSILAEITSETSRPDIRVQMKSADMSTFISGFHFLYPGLAGTGVSIVAMVCELIMLKASRERLPIPNATSAFSPFAEDPGAFVYVTTNLALVLVGFAVFMIIPLLLGGITSHITKRYMARTITPIALNFSELKLSAWNMRMQLKRFRKFMDAEYKKIAPH